MLMGLAARAGAFRMVDRRSFLRLAGMSLACTAWAGWVRADRPRLPSRLVPGTDERLPIIGLGNSQAFRDGDLARSKTLIDYFHAQGGAYIDVSGPSRFVTARIARDLVISNDLFFGTYIETGDDSQDRAEAREVLAAQQKDQLDLVLTRDVTGFRTRRASYEGLLKAARVELPPYRRRPAS